MSRTKETTVFWLALLMTLGLVGSGIWWFINKFRDEAIAPRANSLQTSPPSDIPSKPPDSFAKVQNVPTGLFSYGGSTTWAPIRGQVDLAIQTVWPHFRLRYIEPTNGVPGSGAGIKMLLNDQLTFAHSSRSLKNEEYQQAQARGSDLKEIPVAIDGIAIAVNPHLNIPGLTVAQLKDIYTGKTTNWHSVGGPNLAIAPYSRRPEDSGTIEFFIENVLNKEKFGTSVQFIPTTTQALRQVATNPGGIYYASAPEVVSQCMVKSLPIGRTSNQLVSPYQEPFIDLSQCPKQRNQLNTEAFKSDRYPITRRLFVIIKQNGQIEQQVGEAYTNLLLTDQGQEFITKTGFVSIR